MEGSGPAPVLAIAGTSGIESREEAAMSVLDRAAERRDALRTDLYQLTMAAAYFEAGLEHESTFELFTRRLEAHRGFYIACGLELALDYLEGLRFTAAE